MLLGPGREKSQRPPEPPRLGNPYAPRARDSENTEAGRQTGDHEGPGVEHDVGGRIGGGHQVKDDVGAEVGPRPYPGRDDRGGRSQRERNTAAPGEARSDPPKQPQREPAAGPAGPGDEKHGGQRAQSDDQAVRHDTLPGGINQ